MKSARERAKELWESLGSAGRVDVDLNYLRDQRGVKGMRAWLRDVELMFKEHARDQRRLCAQRMGRLAEMYAGEGIANEQHLVQMASAIAENASAPGES